ncbi:MAG: hypothetical protein EHM35_09705 [Planctomycetaceae bacterium]|nr:MAG: hypothetical protein EHM35_09705 [Planctomycetaceae bacterium]
MHGSAIRIISHIEEDILLAQKKRSVQRALKVRQIDMHLRESGQRCPGQRDEFEDSRQDA